MYWARLPNFIGDGNLSDLNSEVSMSYTEHWAALAARIGGLRSAGALSASFGPDNYGAGRFLLEQCGFAVQTLEEFRRDYAASLPPQALQSLDRFLGTTVAKAARTAQLRNRALSRLLWRSPRSNPKLRTS